MTCREGVSYALESSLSAGDDSVTVSAHVIHLLSPSSFVAQSRVQKLTVIVRLNTSSAPASGVVSLFQFSLARDADVLYLHEEGHSLWTLHETLQAHPPDCMFPLPQLGNNHEMPLCKTPQALPPSNNGGPVLNKDCQPRRSG